jgi:hypothetical protein
MAQRRAHTVLVASASGADAAVTGASVGIAAQPVGSARFEWVAPMRGHYRIMGRIMDRSMPVDLSVGVLARVSRDGVRQHDVNARGKIEVFIVSPP